MPFEIGALHVSIYVFLKQRDDKVLNLKLKYAFGIQFQKQYLLLIAVIGF